MGTILTLAVSAYFFIASYRLQFAYFLFVFLIPFLTKYIGFGVGREGFALSLKRILLMILFMWFAFSLTQNWEYIAKRISLVYQQNKILINLFLLFFILKIFSLSIGSRQLSQYIALFDDFLFTIFIFTLTILIINSKDAFHHLINVFYYGYTITLILVLIESIVKHPLLSIFASGQMELARDVSSSFIRDGGYRTTGGFSNPIVLGNYLIALFPIIMTYININKYSMIFKMTYFLLFVYAVYATGSRSALLFFVVGTYLYIIFFLFKRGSQLTRYITFVINLIITIFVAYFGYNYINDLIISFGGRYDLIEDRSSTARAMQYVAIYDKMHEAPFFGFGRMRNFTEDLGEHLQIDNYYFWQILEVGVIGMIVYLLFFYFVVKTAYSLYKSSYQNDYLLPLLVSILILIFYQLLSAVKDVQIYLYIFIGLVCAMKVLQNNAEEKNI